MRLPYFSFHLRTASMLKHILADKLTASLVVAGWTFPFWFPTLGVISHTFGLLVPVAALVLFVIKIWAELAKLPGVGVRGPRALLAHGMSYMPRRHWRPRGRIGCIPALTPRPGDVVIASDNAGTFAGFFVKLTRGYVHATVAGAIVKIPKRQVLGFRRYRSPWRSSANLAVAIGAAISAIATAALAMLEFVPEVFERVQDPLNALGFSKLAQGAAIAQSVTAFLLFLYTLIRRIQQHKEIGA